MTRPRERAKKADRALAFGHDGQSAYVATKDLVLEYWAASETGEWSRQASFRGHTNEITSVVAAPVGTGAVSLSYDGTARNWQSTNSSPVRILGPGLVNVFAVALAPSTSTIAIAQTKDIQLFDIASGNLVTTLVGPGNGYPLVSKLKFVTDKRLIAGTKNGKIFIWDTDKQDIEAIFEISPDPDSNIVVTDLDISSDGKRLVSASSDNAARLWELETGKLVREFGNSKGELSAAKLSPDGRTLFTGTGENEILVWNVETGQQTDVIPDRGEALALDPNGKYLVASSHSKSPNLWETESKKRHSLGLFADAPTWIEFSRDGKQFAMAFGYNDGNVRVFDTATKTIAYEMRGHKGSVSFAGYLGDGASIATAGSHDNTIRIWPRYGNLAELIASSGRLVQKLKPLSRQEVCALKLSSRFEDRPDLNCEESAAQ